MAVVVTGMVVEGGLVSAGSEKPKAKRDSK